MAVKLKRFDAAKYIRTPEEEAEALTNALASGDACYIAAAIGAIARARSMTYLAEATGLNRTALYEAFSEGGNPTLDTVMRVMNALDIRLTAFAVDEMPDEAVDRIYA